MSLTLAQTLIERRLNIWEGLKATLDLAETEGRDLTVEENTSVDERNADLTALDARIKLLVDTEKRGQDAIAAMSALANTPKASDAPSKNDELRAFFTGQRGKAAEFRADGPVDFRALSKLTAAAGANTVKVSFYERLVAHMIEVSGILAAGPTVLNTASGEQIQVPKTTAHSTAALVAEAGTIGASDPTFGQVPLDAYKYAFLLQVSNELLTDTSVDLEGYLSMQAGRALGNALGTALITGTGSSQPQGIVPVATLGVTGGTAVSGVFTADNLIDLFYSVIAPYRASSSCGWLMRDATVATVRKLKDTAGNYIFAPALSLDQPDTLLNKPLRTDPNVAATAITAKSVLFGDFSQYFVRLAGGVRFERSDDYAFNTDLVTFRAIVRGDGDLIDTTGAVKYFAGGAS